MRLKIQRLVVEPAFGVEPMMSVKSTVASTRSDLGTGHAGDELLYLGEEDLGAFAEECVVLTRQIDVPRLGDVLAEISRALGGFARAKTRLRFSRLVGRETA